MRQAFILGTVLTASVIGSLALSGAGTGRAGTGSAGAASAAPRRAPEEPSPPAYDIIMQEAWIPMRDGVRLAADIYFPKRAEPGAAGAGGRAAAKNRSKERFPVLLEYLPYRKTESRGDRYRLNSYFVRRGYIVARVDIRGTGNSEGRLIEYEYSEQEQRDGEDVIAWLARQPFSTGKIGMFGISWGGFNSIHMAMRNPPALKAIIAVDATDDLYEDDVHSIDGGMHVDSYEMGVDIANSMPGAPDYVIDEAFFRDRFDTPPWMLTYKRQQRDGPFWDRTALKTRYDAIKIPTFVIGGWYDAYRDSVPRMLEHLKAPIKAMVGPWAHAFPHDAYPKPQMEWRHEAVRWYDQWLKGKNTGIMDEPRFAVYVRHWHPPQTDLETVPGEWRWEDGWPIARIRQQPLYPQPNHTLADAVPAGSASHPLRYVPTSGAEAGGPVMWWGDMAPDQRPTDAFALVYDSDPLEEEIEILGLPRAVLNVAADAPLAHWFARLSDVAPDGAVTLVAGAGFNGAHRESSRQPKALEPGREVTLDIEMHFTSWVFPKGHRMRLAVSNAQWPMIWPTPYPLTTTLRLGGPDPTRLVLPVVPRAGRPAPKFLPPEADPTLAGFSALETGTASGYGEISSIERSWQRRATRVVATYAGGAKYPWGTERSTESITHEAQDDHPEATSVLDEYSTTVQLPDRTLRWEARMTFRSDRDNFYYTYFRRLLKDGTLVREKSWEDTIPRDFQ
jgi:predicted acyl esterase